WLGFVILGLSLALVPVLSWHCLEKPISNLKDAIGWRDRTIGARSTRWPGYAALAACVALVAGVAASEGVAFWQGLTERAMLARRLEDSGVAPGRVYYVSHSGNDANLGTSPEESWRTLAQVNRAAFAPGDEIRLEGGQVFPGGLCIDRAPGTPARPI